MRTFLEDVAESLLNRFGNNLSEVTVVFPGKRAGLFLNQALVEQSHQPVWAPRYMTISELFHDASELELCDSIEALCLLYEVYCKCVEQPLSFDKFYHWGELMLSDFDDIDKHLVNAHLLFQNAYELHEMDGVDFLTKDQVEALQSFFKDFSIESNSDLKKRFLRIWSKMSVIYDKLNDVMCKMGRCYEGALQRAVVNNLKTNDKFHCQHYVFVGFNVLNEVEKALFNELKSRGRALFYWDYDIFYTTPSDENGFSKEAGYFMQQNLKEYRNELPAEKFDNFSKTKELHMVSATSENIQASFMTTWLSNHRRETESNTAVVLCNEQLLQPVLQSLPDCFSQVNVTMGYPLSDTPAFGFLSNLLDLMTQGVTSKGLFRPRFLNAVLAHPFANFVDEKVWKQRPGSGLKVLNCLLEVVMELGKHFNAEPSSILTRESIFQCYKVLNRLNDLMNQHHVLVELNDLTLRHVILSTLRSQSIPFHGEPAVGLQLMGVLETRCLDFDDLLMLSVGEGYLPKHVMDTSLIPYVLKERYGLSTARHKMAVFAYYFFRLISRVSHVTFVYNDSNSGISQNEISRFLRQLIAETQLPITFERLQSDNNTTSHVVNEIEKTPQMIAKMLDHFSETSDSNDLKHAISPTELNTYTKCGLNYYYQYVCGMKVDDEEEEGINAILFGRLIHSCAENVYNYLTRNGKEIQKQAIDELLNKNSSMLQRFVDDAFVANKESMDGRQSEGVVKLVKDVLKNYLRNLLKQDMQLQHFSFIAAEKKLKMMVKTTFDGGDGLGEHEIEVGVGGTIDRLDSIFDKDTGKETMRVVDYKTSKDFLSNVDINALFSASSQHKGYYFQTMLYALLASANNGYCSVTPCLYYLRKSGSKQFEWKLKINGQRVDNILIYRDDFLEKLKHLLHEMLQKDLPFSAAADKANCEHCSFKLLCGR